jgi:hypothetical protein
MSVATQTEWPDGRIDELARRVEKAATKDELQLLRRELGERSEGVKKDVAAVGAKVDSLVGDPVVEGRAKRSAIIVGVVAALAGVAGTSLLYVLAGAVPH